MTNAQHNASDAFQELILDQTIKFFSGVYQVWCRVEEAVEAEERFAKNPKFTGNAMDFIEKRSAVARRAVDMFNEHYGIQYHECYSLYRKVNTERRAEIAKEAGHRSLFEVMNDDYVMFDEPDENGHVGENVWDVITISERGREFVRKLVLGAAQ